MGHPSKLNPLVQEFLYGTGSVDDGKDESDWSMMPEPSFDNPHEWVRWCACQVETPAWWPELQNVPTQRDTIGFAKQVQASFHLPKAKCLTRGKENDYTPPPMPHCIKWDTFLPFDNGNFANQDYRMKQPQKMLAYAKALQFWAKKAQLPWASQPHQLAACVKESKESMELLTSFTNEEVLTKEPSSHWVKVTSSRPSKLAEPEETCGNKAIIDVGEPALWVLFQ